MKSHRAVSLRRHRSLWTVSAAVSPLVLALVSLAAGSAHAQGVTNLKPAHPDVLLLIDTSGSMERMADGTMPVCTPGTATAPNRWAQVLQVLTGEVQPFFSCQAVDRSTTAFIQEYQIKSGGTNHRPYDTNYVLPYHRPLSKTTSDNCVVGPGSLPGMDPAMGGVGPNGDRGLGGAAWEFPVGSIVHRLASTPLTTTPDANLYCFDQLRNGILDTAGAQVRFGLMTFDSDPQQQTGVVLGDFTASTPLVTTGDPFLGGWSYFPHWTNSTAGVAKGRPLGCEEDAVLEVGARNFAAPPWEGRAIGFSNFAVPNPTPQQSQDINEKIQQAILAIRPYGATPIAGLLADAEHYWYDDNDGPSGGPSSSPNDTYFVGKCRKAYNILLTDGTENLHMRPDCVGGTCPFPTSDATAINMRDGVGASKNPVLTFVVGFNVSATGDGAGESCSAVNQANCANPTTTAEQVCCPFHNLAVAGGTVKAYFAESAASLASQLQTIIGSIAQDATPLTVPAFSQATANTASGGSSTSKFLASFDPNLGPHWPGRIQRKRNICEGAPLAPVEKPVDIAKGDDFAVNLNAATPSTRKYFAVRSTTATVPATTSTLRSLTGTTPDGIPENTFTMVNATSSPDDIWSTTGIDAARMGVTDTTCVGRTPSDHLTAVQCAERALRFAMAQPSRDYGIRFDRVPDPTTNAFRNIFRATPAVYTPGAALLRDPTYEAYSNTNLVKYRAIAARPVFTDEPNKIPAKPSVIAAAINDGTFSLWYGDLEKQANNQLWAMLLPKALPSLHSAVSTRQQLADGRPVVQDVVFQRTLADVLAGTNKWHTVAVAGYGENGPGYYAIDFSDPEAPRFLWQITSPEIFGPVSGTPVITTIVTKGPQDSDPVVERGVAILVGGHNKQGGNGSCNRALSSGGSPVSFGAANALPEDFTARGTVKSETAACTDKLPGRSVAIVDIETGELLRVFMRETDRPTYLPTGKVINTLFDNTFVGEPAVYPAGTGAVATRFYAGDRMGTLWRFDVSNRNPDLWTGELAMDLYNSTAYGAADALRTTGDPALPAVNDAAQPIEIQPLVSTDESGNSVVMVASGSQDDFFVTGRVAFIYSLRESFDSSRKRRFSLNWLEPMLNEVPSGPITVFDGTAFFARYRAPVGNVNCDSGVARICGMHYIRPNTSSGDTRLKGGDDAKVLNPVSGGACMDAGSGVVPGVTINQTTNCAETVTEAASGHVAVTGISTGSYSVYAQTSGRDPTNAQAGKVIERAIRHPRYNALMDSWALVTD